MMDQCFYCETELGDESTHFVSFFYNDVEREESLCPNCYQDWLEGIKE